MLARFRTSRCSSQLERLRFPVVAYSSSMTCCRAAVCTCACARANATDTPRRGVALAPLRSGVAHMFADNRLAKLLDRGPLKDATRKQRAVEVSLTKSLNVTVH